jgi:hypothetical protein
MHGSIAGGSISSPRSGLDWTSKYPATAAALKQLPVARAYLDGELCAVRPDGTTSFSLMQATTDGASAAGLVYFVFDALHLDGEDLLLKSLLERKARLAEIMKRAPSTLQFSDHLGALLLAYEFPDLRVARLEAVRLAGQLLLDRPAEFCKDLAWQIQVIDDGGAAVFEVDLRAGEALLKKQT